MGPSVHGSILSRIAAAGRPSRDDACAGCGQLVMLRSIRRAGLGMQGTLGCDPGATAGYVPAQGRWAAIAGARRVIDGGARDLLEGAARAGAALVLVADDLPSSTSHVEALLRAAGARVERLDTTDLRVCDGIVERSAGRGAVLVSMSACTRGRARASAVVVAPVRCNRCGACLSLGCPALSDPGEEAMRVDPGVCTGCRICVPLCRGGALMG